MCRRFKVSGRVQGVFFRDSTRAKAAGLGLAGYAYNLPDGDVDVCMCGDAAALDEMVHWLTTGPPLAAVKNVAEETVACGHPIGFRIG